MELETDYYTKHRTSRGTGSGSSRSAVKQRRKKRRKEATEDVASKVEETPVPVKEPHQKERVKRLTEDAEYYPPEYWAKILATEFEQYVELGYGIPGGAMPDLALDISYTPLEDGDSGMPALRRVGFYWKTTTCTIYLALIGAIPFAYIPDVAFKGDMGDKFSLHAPNGSQYEYATHLRSIISSVAKLVWPETNLAYFVEHSFLVEVEITKGVRYIIIAPPVNACPLFVYSFTVNSMNTISDEEKSPVTTMLIRIFCMLQAMGRYDYCTASRLISMISETRKNHPIAFLQSAERILTSPKKVSHIVAASSVIYLNLCLDASTQGYCLVSTEEDAPKGGESSG